MTNDLIIKINYNPGGKHLKRMLDSQDYFEVRLDGKLIGKIKEGKNFLVSNGIHTIQCNFHTDEFDIEKSKTVHVKRELGVYQFDVSNENKNFTVNYYSKWQIDFSEGDIPMDLEKAAKLAKGCYIATCVYGSYDCPQVWTLRRFRDNTLGSTWYGRAFIRTYYAISPTLVKWFGNTTWFKKIWKGTLDRMVKKLEENGVENTPYEDKIW